MGEVTKPVGVNQFLAGEYDARESQTDFERLERKTKRGATTWSWCFSTLYETGDQSANDRLICIVYGPSSSCVHLSTVLPWLRVLLHRFRVLYYEADVN